MICAMFSIRTILRRTILRRTIIMSRSAVSYNSIKAAVDAAVLQDSKTVLCEPAVVHKKDGRTLHVASLFELASLVDPVVFDVRDANEIPKNPSVDTAIHLPMNIDQQKQSVRPTSYEEFVEKYEHLKMDLALQTPIITHCTSGGRGALAAEYLRRMGFSKVLNGGDPQRVRCALQEQTADILGACEDCEK